MATKLTLERKVNSLMRKPPTSKTSPRDRIYPPYGPLEAIVMDDIL